jgi:hypothetical protein
LLLYAIKKIVFLTIKNHFLPLKSDVHKRVSNGLISQAKLAV